VDLRAGLDDLEKRKFLTLPGLELLPLDRPARSYPGSSLFLILLVIMFGMCCLLSVLHTIAYFCTL
jgi:hypothetical protein